MKTKTIFTTVLILTFSWAFGQQFVPVPLPPDAVLPEYPIDRVAETVDGVQYISLLNGYFKKHVEEDTWTPLDINDQSGEGTWSSLFVDADGGLYLTSQGGTLFSSDEGETFTPIEYPATSSLHSRLRVLGNQVLVYSVANPWADFYYSTNNGESWIEIQYNTDFGIGLTDQARLVGDYIYWIIYDDDTAFFRINIETGELETNYFYQYPDIYAYLITMREDGVAFINGGAWADDSFEVYECVFGQAPVLNEELSNLGPSHLQSASNNELLAFRVDSSFLYTDALVKGEPIQGIPNVPQPFGFWVTDSRYVFYLTENGLYRSVTEIGESEWLSGKVLYDSNPDCLEENETIGLPYWKIRLENDELSASLETRSDGEYRVGVPPGTYELSVEPANSEWDLCVGSYTVELVDAPQSQNFLARATENCSNLTVNLSTPLLRRCFDNFYQVSVRNDGPAPSENTIVDITLDPFFDLQSVDLPHTVLNDTTIRMELGDLTLGEQIDFRFYFNLSCEAELSQVHCTNMFVSSETACDGLTISEKECQENIGSYDPNDKRTFSTEGRETAAFDLEEEIIYHVRFQNTGTDTAFTVRVVDYLDAKLDLNTFEFLGASHDYTYELTNRKLEVFFEDILLPDSTTNEVLSHGFFKFKIKPLPGFGYGTQIPNEAAIYFDFNEPVITNTAVLELRDPTYVFSPENQLGLRMFPNPVSDRLWVEQIENGQGIGDHYEIHNQLGQLVVSGPLNAMTSQVDVQGLTSGVYYLLIRQQGHLLGGGKFVKD